MKTKLTLALAALLVLSALLGCAYAEGNTSVAILGTGSKPILVYISFGDKTAALYEVDTDQDMLMAALEEVGLIKTEKVSWGYNVVTVDGRTADYNKAGEYWSIGLFDEEDGEFYRMETALEKTPLVPMSTIGFFLEK